MRVKGNEGSLMKKLWYGKLHIIGAFSWMFNLLKDLESVITSNIKIFVCIIHYISLNKLTKVNSLPQWKFLSLI